jgi:pentatricopeptide repeat protein
VLSPDIISYNSVIEALGAAGRAADALALLPVLRCADLQATVTTMEALLSISFHGGMMHEVVSLWRDMARCGMRPSPHSLNMFLRALISLVRSPPPYFTRPLLLYCSLLEPCILEPNSVHDAMGSPFHGKHGDI